MIAHQDVALLMADNALRKKYSPDLAHLAMRWAFPSMADAHPCECVVCDAIVVTRFHEGDSVDLTTLTDDERAHAVPPYGWLITTIKSDTTTPPAQTTEGK